ncbi:MAG: tetratricopeptide repeat protein [Synechococcales bacterium]|nr:tetratricopeptide repeat protein [Synechococcales bacterium]
MIDTGRIPLTGDTLAWFREGLNQANAKEWEKAVAAYNRVLQVRPDFWEAWYERGLVLEELGFFAEAVRSYDRALAQEPNEDARVSILYHQGNSYQYGLGDNDAARDCYDRLLRQNAHHALTWLHRGNLLLYGYREAEAALTSYQNALGEDPTNSVIWRNQGNALVELKRYQDAIVSYERALNLNPEDAIARQGQQLAIQQSNLTLRPPTTRPVWFQEYNDDTLVEGERLRHVLPTIDHPAWIGLAQTPVLIVEDSEGRRDIPLEEVCYTLGRDPRNTICLRSQFASRFHAVLRVSVRPEGGKVYTITDGNLDGKPSTNGLMINGQRMNSKELQNGDSIVFDPKSHATFRAPTGF